MSLGGKAIEILFEVCKKLAEISFAIIKYWIKYILPIFLAISFFFFFISKGISIGLETGIIIMFLIISGLIGIYLINGKTFFIKIISNMNNMASFLDKEDKKNDNSNNNNNNNNNN